VRPETLIRWHRAGWKLLWRLKSRPSRPAIPLELQKLIRRMADENPTWGAPMTGLGPDWTGPAGVGDYARANGNTAEVVNGAHNGDKNQAFDKFLNSATDTGETFDLIIVGFGLAGLGACYTYHKERPNGRVLQLDQHAIFGGEARHRHDSVS
jgi:hypothetical protein